MTSIWKKRLSLGYWTLMAVWLAFWPLHAFAQAIDIPPATVSTNALWLIVYGLIVSLITSGITNLPPNFTAWQKRGIAAVLSAVLAAVTLGYAGQLDTTDFARTWLVIFIAASGIYTVLSRPIADLATGRPQT
jgi:hypothetical protein